MNGYLTNYNQGGFRSESPQSLTSGYTPSIRSDLERPSKSNAKSLYEQRRHYARDGASTISDTSQYQVEHLTTFVMDRKDAVLTVEDGIRKLKLLDAKGKVWTQDMCLQVDDKGVSLYDIESKGSFIQQDIDSAISDSKGGKLKKRPDALRAISTSDSRIPPPPPPLPQGDNRNRVAAWSSRSSAYGSIDKTRQSVEWAETPEMTEARIDRDVQILNHLLDDVEFFIMKLQKAAEAFSELSKRRKSKKKKKGPGEGVLTVRAKPPPHEEFVDCFQKFKHAFNLLAKLKPHIQNPSASELVHFLFTPLSMMVDATGGPDLARSILSPLLTKDAIDYLQYLLNAEEKRLWMSLGESWSKTRIRLSPTIRFQTGIFLSLSLKSITLSPHGMCTFVAVTSRDVHVCRCHLTGCARLSLSPHGMCTFVALTSRNVHVCRCHHTGCARLSLSPHGMCTFVALTSRNVHVCRCHHTGCARLSLSPHGMCTFVALTSRDVHVCRSLLLKNESC
uniref:EGFR pathway substrate 8, signaling adaptor n=1 Tax=Leptobrachium leishanense TaxID=445787 RepID=A0A8C5PI33_9ANUR